MTLLENYLTRPIEKDAAGKIRGTRLWHATNVDSAGAISEFYASSANLTFPSDPTLTFDSVRVSPNALGTGQTVEATYSNYKSGRFTQLPPRDTLGYKHYGWGSRDVTVEIPVNIREQRVIKGPDDTDQTIQVWVSSSIKVDEARPQYKLEFRVGAIAFDQFDPIATQRNRIHTLFGKKLQFVNGIVSEGDGTYFDIMYVWEWDVGTTRPTGGGANFVILDPENRAADPILIRKPYEVLSVMPSDDPETTPHDTVALSPYYEDPQGWQALPGIVA